MRDCVHMTIKKKKKKGKKTSQACRSSISIIQELQRGHSHLPSPQHHYQLGNIRKTAFALTCKAVSTALLLLCVGLHCRSKHSQYPLMGIILASKTAFTSFRRSKTAVINLISWSRSWKLYPPVSRLHCMMYCGALAAKKL